MVKNGELLGDVVGLFKKFSVMYDEILFVYSNSTELV